MRPRLFVPTYQHHRGSGQAYIRVGEANIYLGKWNTPESRQAYARYLLGLDAVLTVEALCAQYLDHCRTYYRRRDGSETQEVRDTVLSFRELLDMHAHDDAASFRAPQLRGIRDVMSRTLSRKVVNQRVGRIVRAWRWAGERDLVPSDTVMSLRTVRGLAAGRSAAVEYEPIGCVDLQTVEATLRHLPTRPTFVVRMMWLTGMRPGEACAMSWPQIDRTGDVWWYRPTQHKTAHRNRRRVIPLGPQCQALMAGLDTLPTYRVDNLCTAVHRAASRASVDPWHPNQIRHSFATRVRTIFGLEAAQVTLGHATADITQIYAERDNTLASEVAMKLG